MSSILHAFTNRRIFVVLLLGFASGLPLAMTAATLQAWLSDLGYDIKTIGWFTVVGLPYTWKFIWSPIIDRFPVPLLGRRRGWILTAQVALALSMVAMAFVDPVNQLVMLAVLAVATALFSATQDIAFDAYNTEVLRPEERGIGAGVSVLGYRIAMLVSGGGSLIIADQFAANYIFSPNAIGADGKPIGNWTLAYLVMASLMLIGIIGTLIAPEPEKKVVPPKSFQEAVIKPFTEFFRRPGAIEMLLFVILYKMDFVLANALSTKFLLDLGFTKTEIAIVYKGFGFAATIAGTLGGGALIVKWGLNRCLWIFGGLQALTTIGYMVLTVVGKDYTVMVTAIVAENFSGGLATAAFVAFIMSLCDIRYTATQYALLSSAMVITRTIAGVPAAYMVSAYGWNIFYGFTIVTGIPALYLLSRFAPWPGWSGKAVGVGDAPKK